MILSWVLLVIFILIEGGAIVLAWPLARGERVPCCQTTTEEAGQNGVGGAGEEDKGEEEEIQNEGAVA